MSSTASSLLGESYSTERTDRLALFVANRYAHGAITERLENHGIVCTGRELDAKYEKND